MRHVNTNGFTLVEMLIVSPLVILLIGSFVYAIVAFTGQGMAERGKALLLNDVHAALDEIEGDVVLSGAFLATNNQTVGSPQGVNNNAQPFLSNSVNNDTLILNSFVTTESPTSPARSLVYLLDAPYACNSPNVNQNQAMTMNIVYFIKNNSLWRRTMMVPNYATKANKAGCPTQNIFQRSSCSPGVTGTLCETQDDQLLDGVPDGGFSLTYYPSASALSPVTGATSSDPTARQAALDAASSINVTLSANGTAAGRDFTQSATGRYTRAGSLIKTATP